MSEEQGTSQEPQSNESRRVHQARNQSSLGIPVAIVIAAALIAGAIFFSGDKNAQPAPSTGVPSPSEQTTPEISVEPINEADHVRGNPNAPIVLVEYSDFDCPFCKRFHEEVLNPLINEYGPDGKLAWVYRHLPLESLHPNAPKIAEASECVAELAGNDAFWKFSDLIFTERDQNEPTDPSRLTEFAEMAGADGGQFELCLNSGKHAQAVTDSIQEAIAANGGTNRLGTPFTLVFVGNEYVGPIVGAQPYASVKNNIDQILLQIEGGIEAN